jgi:hypothetical protein
VSSLVQYKPLKKPSSHRSSGGGELRGGVAIVYVGYGPHLSHEVIEYPFIGGYRQFFVKKFVSLSCSDPYPPWNYITPFSPITEHVSTKNLSHTKHFSMKTLLIDLIGNRKCM